LKFCGGCRAGYDRVELARAIEEQLAGKMEWTGADSADAEEIVILCGCPTACTRLDFAAGRPVCRITGPQEAGRWISGIRQRIP
jgi:hypothetical protein